VTDEPTPTAGTPAAPETLRPLLLTVRHPTHRVPVIGVDGRSAAGKSTLARRLADLLAPTTTIHTDDIAWWHSHFDWPDVLVDDVLTPLLGGRDVVAYRPPGWVAKDRPGSLDYRADVRAILVEGVGATQARMRPHLDLAVWVASDRAVATARGLERDTQRFGSRAAAQADWDDWQAAEVPFLAAERPWAHAGLVVAGTGTASDVAVGDFLVVAGPA